MFQDLNEISDGKIYGANDMVRTSCSDCKGCHACCEDMGASIVLDPYDMWNLGQGTGKHFDRLLFKEIELGVEAGCILPHLKMEENTICCPFLDKTGRCSIHRYRPGLCRVFPLGRIYEEDKIRYFLQKGACKNPGKTKIKVMKWLDMPLQKKHESFLLAWHKLRRQTEQEIEKMDEASVKSVNMFLLNLFFVTPYEQERDFYVQFEERCKRAQEVLPFLRLS